MINWEGIVSLFIACIELVLIINVLVFAENNSAIRSGLIILVLLSIYQLFEFIICGLGVKASLAVYIAFFDITMLPPAALLFVLDITKKKKSVVFLSLIPAIFFIFYYGISIYEMQVTKCTVLYAVYNYPLGVYYGVFYYSSFIISIIFLYFYWKRENRKKERILTAVLLSGFIITATPVLTAFILRLAGNTTLLNAIESIMCKFAFSIALAVGIYSLSHFRKK